MKENSKAIQFLHPLYDTIDEDLSDITALYLRVSTDSQAQDGYGLDVQYDSVRRFCDAFNYPNPVVFIDDGYTGVNADRPAFKALTKAMSERRVKMVLTHSLDRIGRTQMLILKFLKEDCVKAQCDFCSVKENIDSRAKQTYDILISILSIFAEFDHDAIVTKLSLGRHQRALDGYWKGGGNPPYGYFYSKEINTLAVDPEKGAKVQKVFELYTSAEYSPMQIANMLGISSDTLVFNILRNRTYLGEITWRGEQYRGVHQRLVSDEMFAEAQEILQRRSRAHGPSHYLLSSLLYCGHCGAKMRYMRWGKAGHKKLKVMCYSRYEQKCKPSLVKDPNCPAPIFDAEAIENIVIEQVMQFAIKYSEDRKKSHVTSDEVVDNLMKLIEEKKTRYARLIKAYEKLDDDSILDKAKELQREIKRHEKDIEDERQKGILTDKIAERVEMIKSLPALWNNMTALEKQRIIRTLVDRVEASEDLVSVYLSKSQYEKMITEDD